MNDGASEPDGWLIDAIAGLRSSARSALRRHAHGARGPGPFLAELGALEAKLRPAVDGMMADCAALALAHGATFEDLGTAVGITRQAASHRWGHLRGERIVVVISRRDRSHPAPEHDSRARVGEVGGSGQYDADRGWWPIGADVRAAAAHAVIAVDGEVRRVYAIDTGGWDSDGRKWRFRAVDDRPLPAQEIDRLHTAGDLPYRLGDPCPTKAGGAYRPERF